MIPVIRKQSQNRWRLQVNITVVVMLYLATVLLNHLTFRISSTVSDELLTPTLWTIRPIPKHISRFDGPWQIPKVTKMKSLKESRNRIIYSPLRDTSGDGLGHAMATTNADVLTSLRLGLTYSHRTPHFATLSLPKNTYIANYTLEKPMYLTSPIEHLFGWGAEEITRESIQDYICDKSKFGNSGYQCRSCNQDDLNILKEERKKEKRFLKNNFHIDHIVMIPDSLSFGWPYGNNLIDELQKFLSKHNNSNTVFSMPVKHCGGSPTYSKFTFESRSWFFHHYWKVHSKMRLERFETKNIIQKIIKSKTKDGLTRIPKGKPRSPLGRLKEEELNIAIHARRGDFFQANREMIPTLAFARVVRRIIYEIKGMDDIFSKMAVSVSIYSEGKSISGIGAGHDVTRMTKDYQDYNGRIQNESEIASIFSNSRIDSLGNVFTNGLTIKMRISENTVDTIHEMISADIFIGSRSGLSMNIVGSMARGAAQFMTWTDYSEKGWCCRVLFSPSDGVMDSSQIHIFHQYWKQFAMANGASAKRALKDRARADSKNFLNVIRQKS